MISHNDSLLQAQNFYTHKKYSEAQKILQDVIESDENNPQGYFILANILHAKGELGKAIKAFSKVIELDPSNTDASISLSIIYNDIGKYELAKTAFENANKNLKQSENGTQDQHINKKFSFKHLELAELYASYNRNEEAIFEYNKASDLDPDNLEIRIKIAKAYSKKGYKAKAFEELKRLKNEHPNYVPARMAIALLHFGQGNVLEAQAEWQTILTKDPAHQEAKMYLELSRTAKEANIQPSLS
jgi:tetratricopeptide (TPR) repeat protein